MVIPLKNMNIILWKNDTWKSTILEALDIFFNDSKAFKKISKDDINKTWLAEWNEKISISVCFEWFDDEIIIDETIPTKLSEEYLLNIEWEVEIKKVYWWATMKWQTYIVANHPKNNETVKDLLLMKISELKKYAQNNDIVADGDWRAALSWRKWIRNSYSPLNLELTDVPVDKAEAKNIREKVAIKMPLYQLFQSDRSNSDQDNEVQDPMKLALKSVLKTQSILDKLSIVFEEVKEELEKISNWTLQQLKTINPSLADELSTHLPEADKLSREKAFWKPDIYSDEIPLNKRWSGVKRMVLLAFFLNEVGRRKSEEWLGNVIYAFEEPETSQHPEHQDILLKAFKELSENEEVQILLTTHSPYVYKKCIQKENINLIHIFDNEWTKEMENINYKFNLFPHSPTWWEINMFVYNLPTYEFFDELYSRLEALKPTNQKIDDFITTKSTILKDISWHISNDDGTQAKKDNWSDKIYDSTYISCIRHKIHHPNNKLNTGYQESEEINWKLEWAINDMINILKDLT